MAQAPPAVNVIAPHPEEGWRELPKEDADGHWEDPDVAFFSFRAGRKPLILPNLGLGSVPHVATYSGEDFTPCMPMVCVALPLVPALRSLPPGIRRALRGAVETERIAGADDIEVWALAHSGFTPTPCGHFRCRSDRHLNLQLHAWAFGDPEEAEIVAVRGEDMSATVFCGLYSPAGGEALPAHEDLIATHLPFNRLEKRIVLAHHGRFSPNNCNFAISRAAKDATFFTVVIDEGRLPSAGKKACVALHFVPVGDPRADEIRDAIRGRRTLEALVAALRPAAPEFGRRLAAMLDGVPLEDSGLDARTEDEPDQDRLDEGGGGGGGRETTGGEGDRTPGSLAAIMRDYYSALERRDRYAAEDAEYYRRLAAAAVDGEVTRATAAAGGGGAGVVAGSGSGAGARARLAVSAAGGSAAADLAAGPESLDDPGEEAVYQRLPRAASGGPGGAGGAEGAEGAGGALGRGGPKPPADGDIMEDDG